MTIPEVLKRILPWLTRRLQIYALVGKSGTGKSFKARNVAQRFGIDLIIDDGLLIKGQKILAGRSAKREKGILSAIKTALFANPEQVDEVRKALEAEAPRKILIIGTSVKMVERIRNTLSLPPLHRLIMIQEVSKPAEIETALRTRMEQGKHIIPVPAIEIKRNYPHIFFESIKILLQGRSRIRTPKENVVEKTVVRPAYSRVRETPKEKSV
jgi:ABC-type dipeptide/oligopeptide/nickel transport system ATPase component